MEGVVFLVPGTHLTKGLWGMIEMLRALLLLLTFILMIQFDTCHASLAVVACAKLLPVWVITFHARELLFFTRFRRTYELYEKDSWTWPGLNSNCRSPCITLQWHHNECDGISAASWLFAQPFVQAQIKGTAKLHVTGFCEGNLPVTGEFPAQRASNMENVFIWWHHHEKMLSS